LADCNAATGRRFVLTSIFIINSLFFNELKWLPCFLAKQEKAFAKRGLACLMTVHSQTYPQFLGVSGEQ
jgi:hypothetical protein